MTHRGNHPLLTGTACIFFTVSSALPALAGVAASTNYSMEYAGVGVSGQPAQSASYSSLTVIRTAGAGVTVATSANYTQKPVVGSSFGPNAKIADWSRYGAGKPSSKNKTGDNY